MKCPHCGKEILLKSDPSRAEKAIAYYYRQRARGGKLSLKQVAAQIGIPYSTITKAKMKYDAAGKYGSQAKVRL